MAFVGDGTAGGLDRVGEDGGQDRPLLADRLGVAGEVDDHDPAGQAGGAPGQHGERGDGQAGVAQGLGDAGGFAVEHGPGRLRGDVAGAEAGAAGGEHDVGVGGHGPQGGGDRLAVVGDHGPGDELGPGGLEQLAERAAAGVVPGPGGHPVAHGQHPDPDPVQVTHVARYSPERPPRLASRRRSSTRTSRWTPLTMSYRVRAAVAAAVRASISTPVRPVVRTVAVICTAPSSGTRSTSTPVIGSGWQSGISSGVRLAPMIPATRATARASPFGRSLAARSSRVAGASTTRQPAVATRSVSGLAETSTIRAAPCSSRWLSPRSRFTGAPPWGSPDPSRPTGAPPWGSPDPSGPVTGPPRPGRRGPAPPAPPTRRRARCARAGPRPARRRPRTRTAPPSPG